MKPTSLTSAVLEILETIDNSKIPADKVISFWNKNNRYAGSKDKAFIGEVIYGILRNRGQLSWWLSHFNSNVNPRTITICYYHFNNKNIDKYFNDEKNKYAPEAISNDEQQLIKNLAKHEHITHSEMPIYSELNISEFLYNKFYETYEMQANHIISALNSPANVDIRINTLKSNINQVKRELLEKDIETDELELLKNGLRLKKRFALSGLDIFKNGFFEIQDYGSQLVSALINAKKGEKIVDFCAGAGGKTLAMADAMENTGRIVYCDISEKRLERAGHRLRRAGVNNAEKRLLSSEKDKWVKRRSHRLDGGFDKVVIDAPCSGTGTWRRNPDQKWRTDETTINELCDLQQNILQSASRLVRPGGKIFYITCSLINDENQNQIDNFLKNNTEFHISSIENIWNDVFDEKYKLDKKTLTLLPNETDSDGFFIAVMERKHLSN